MKRTIEERLHRMEDRAAMLRYLLESAALNRGEAPGSRELDGLAAEMERMAKALRKVRKDLDADGS